MKKFKDENKNIIEQRQAAMLLAEDIMSLLDSNFTFCEVRSLAEKRAAELKHLLCAAHFASIGKMGENSATCKDCLQVAAEPHKMSVREYAHHKARMCFHRSCDKCPLGVVAGAGGLNCLHACMTFQIHFPDEAVRIVAEWAREHPERSEGDNGTNKDAEEDFDEFKEE